MISLLRPLFPSARAHSQSAAVSPAGATRANNDCDSMHNVAASSNICESYTAVFLAPAMPAELLEPRLLSVQSVAELTFELLSQKRHVRTGHLHDLIGAALKSAEDCVLDNN